jgi:hypothetical protein
MPIRTKVNQNMPIIGHILRMTNKCDCIRQSCRSRIIITCLKEKRMTREVGYITTVSEIHAKIEVARCP